tara:strand:+ start:1481 stop:2794 length:1314 start_codon:yes stop_codon:yes gene_type:complete
MKPVKTKFFLIIPFFITLTYILDFYVLDSLSSQQFWCVEIYREFSFLNFNNLRLPIHCDEGPYRFASESLSNFFDETNPYQGRPLFILSISIFRNIFNILSFINISEYLIFRIAMLFIQFIVLFFIIRIFVSLTNLDFQSKTDYLIIFLVISTPSIRWNIFFSSVENLTFLLFLLSLKYLLSDQENSTRKNSAFILLGVLSLAHMSAIVYGFIILLFEKINKKEIKFSLLIKRIFYLLVFQVMYRLTVYFSDYSFYDWHKEIYNQFYWIFDVIQGKPPIAECQTLNTFWKCNILVTGSFLGYFLILMLYLVSIVLVSLYFKENVPELIKYSFFVNLFIFFFWSLQGLYEPFRFVNYSIGYFLFFSLFIYTTMYKKNLYLTLSILIFQFSVIYLEPYNTALNIPQVNVLTIISVLFFLVFLTQFSLKKQKENNFTKYN